MIQIMEFVSDIEKALWEKEKMLITYKVFKNFLPVCLDSVGKGYTTDF